MRAGIDMHECMHSLVGPPNLKNVTNFTCFMIYACMSESQSLIYSLYTWGALTLLMKSRVLI